MLGWIREQLQPITLWAREQLQPEVRKLSSFTYLNITQFLGAMNDNIFKLLVIYFFIQQEGIERSHVVLATTGIIYVLPFLLFSSSAGILADQFSKRNIIISTKVLELVIMILGLAAFAFSSQYGAYFALFLLATHSALFSPSKYGILPELMPPEKISRANGLMTSFTYLAIILGTFLASFLLDVSSRSFLVASLFCISISIVGVITSCCVEYTPPSGTRSKLQVRFIYDIYRTLVQVKEEPSLLAAILGSAFFLFLAAYVQLNMIPFAVQSLGLTDVQGGYLFLLTALGIGTGSLIAGKISGKKAELGLVPMAGLGITLCFYALDASATQFWPCVALVSLIGMFGGIYLIPLDSYIQISSPKKIIGQVVAATTFLSFVGVFGASMLLYSVKEIFGLQPHEGFSILGTITLSLTILYTYLFFDYLTRFVGMVLSRLHFAIQFKGQENVPDVPALYVCSHTAWNDTLLLLGSQRRRMRFFIEQEQDHSKWLKQLYRLLRVVMINEIEPLENNAECLAEIKKALSKGISVCIFIDGQDVNLHLEKLKHAYMVRQIMQETECPLIAVQLEKGEKKNQSRFFSRLMNKIRVPAIVSFKSIVWPEVPSESQHTEALESYSSHKPVPPKSIMFRERQADM